MGWEIKQRYAGLVMDSEARIPLWAKARYLRPSRFLLNLLLIGWEPFETAEQNNQDRTQNQKDINQSS